ncbi:FAD-dependent monooxygenase [Methylobacterium sp. 092160098-2]|uniref:2-polyprenyl-6-methoxyphenol hydroxylase-like FAD-dependent oxidoreductase n=1 Tax=Methylobacterium fujisawaense TaxID=107400 RepID=A0ABR6DI28_9HYPH|nr:MULTISPECIES: FAD-dependent monooxygenase [unclassified Methylobacterium]MBA9065472.1 2-polyprenyl-6-methoxyphenol hydroxylase-like FAD-dependent oxidoreductase [Methylobacterium fujisawaense]MDE4915285.1 FAD-dependent monooxygenase [Methylobacterium sp. 092160098-2]MDH3031205.1 FAD-dependent monooxygenase [Methylobacterium fujisawaense]WFS09183.1 FAD-dependent monooxygenase [Methylobacterium sp. 391_Methyba4]
MKIIIIGAGIGGLCLAQHLRASQIEVAVYDRDAGPWDRKQGYRLHLDADGISALKAALPGPLFALFEATSMHPLPYTTIMDTSFAIQRRFQTDDYSKTQHHLTDGIAQHLNVNRATLREILLQDLEDVCHWDARLEGYETDETGVSAIFSDGRTARGTMLVGADGAGSALRRQRAPDAKMMDSGARAIYGRLALSDARRVLPPHALADIFTAAFDTRKLILGVGPVIYPMAPDQAARALLPQARLRTQDDYIGCIIAGRKELFGDDEAALRAASSDTLQDLASRLLAEWPSGAAKVPRAGEAGSFFYVEMASCIPFDLQPETRVTLLGDAIHTMTPSLGRGANVALRDAGLLRNWIVKHHKGELSCDAALQAYEREMTTYGFEVVRRSADMGAKLLGQDPLSPS